MIVPSTCALFEPSKYLVREEVADLQVASYYNSNALGDPNFLPACFLAIAITSMFDSAVSMSSLSDNSEQYLVPNLDRRHHKNSIQRVVGAECNTELHHSLHGQEGLPSSVQSH